MNEPELVTATQEPEEILQRARALSDQQYRLSREGWPPLVPVMLKLQDAKTSIKRLQRMLFRRRTEHKRAVLERAADGDPPRRKLGSAVTSSKRPNPFVSAIEENPRGRAYRLNVKPGVTTATFQRPANTLIVAISGGRMSELLERN